MACEFAKAALDALQQWSSGRSLLLPRSPSCKCCKPSKCIYNSALHAQCSVSQVCRQLCPACPWAVCVAVWLYARLCCSLAVRTWLTDQWACRASSICTWLTEQWACRAELWHFIIASWHFIAGHVNCRTISDHEGSYRIIIEIYGLSQY